RRIFCDVHRIFSPRALAQAVRETLRPLWKSIVLCVRKRRPTGSSVSSERLGKAVANKTKKREPLRRPPAQRTKRPSDGRPVHSKLDFQDPHSIESRRNSLESAIGREVRDFRRKLNMTVAELATVAGMST